MADREHDARPDWPAFQRRLARALRKLSDGQFLILTHTASGLYVQFACDARPGLRAECVSNGYLEGAARLRTDQVLALRGAGWKDPTHAPDAPARRRPSDGSPNFHADFGGPRRTATAAAMGVVTLHDVLGIGAPSELACRAFDAKGGVLAFPGLCGGRPRPGVGATPSEPMQAVLAAAREATGIGDLVLDADGDLVLGLGDRSVCVHWLQPLDLVVVSSQLLDGVNDSRALLGALNELNSRSPWLRYEWQDQAVYVAMFIPGRPVVAADVGRALSLFAALTEGSDVLLQRRCGGVRVAACAAPTLH